MATPLNVEGMFEMFKGRVLRVTILEGEGNALYKIKLASGAVLDHVHGRFLTFFTSSVERSAPKREVDTSSHANDESGGHHASQTS